MPRDGSDPVLAPDIEVARRHVELLTGLPDTRLHFRLIHDSDKTAPTWKLGPVTIDDAWPRIVQEQQAGYGTFLVVNEGGQSKASITRIRALFIDADNKGVPHTFHVEPDFMAMRDPTHWHAYWRVDRMPVEEFTPAQDRLRAHYGTDRVSDPPRVMRLAGTLHQKDPTHPHLVQLIEEAGDACLLGRSACEILDGLPPLPPAPEPSTPSPATGRPVTPEMLREMLSYIQPPEETNEWLPVALAIQHGQIPLTKAWSADEWRALQDEWSYGNLWRERLGLSEDDFRVINYDPEGNNARLGKHGRDHDIAGIATIIALANRGGYTGPIDGTPFEETEFGKVCLDRAQREQAVSGGTEQAEAKPTYRFQLRDEATQDAAPDIVPLIDDFLPDGGTACIHGPLGSYKSFMATEIAFAVASGLPCFGKLPVRRVGPVIYLAGEGATGIEKRRRPALRHAYGVVGPLPFYTVTAVPLTREGSAAVQACVDDIRAQLGPGVRPGLVILDTKTVAMAGMNEDKAGDAQMYVEGATLIADQLGCLMLTVAHEGLVTGRMRGSTAAPAGIENNWTIENDTDHRVACLKPSRLKDDDLEPIYLQGRPVDVPGLPKPGMVFDVITREEHARLTGKGAKKDIPALSHRERIRQALEACNLIRPMEVTTKLFAEAWVDADLEEGGAAPTPTGKMEFTRQEHVTATVRWLENQSTPASNSRPKPAAGYFRMETATEAKAAGRGMPAKLWSMWPDDGDEGSLPA